MHPAALATGIAAIDAMIAGQAVYAVRRRGRTTGRELKRNHAPAKRTGH